MTEFIRAVKRPKLLSDRPSQQPRPAYLTPTVPAPEDSFVLDEDGNLADGHGNNYVVLDDKNRRQADPTWTRQPGGRQLPPVTPSPLAPRHMGAVHGQSMIPS